MEVTGLRGALGGTPMRPLENWPLPAVLIVLLWTQHPSDVPWRERDWREEGSKAKPIQPFLI